MKKTILTTALMIALAITTSSKAQNDLVCDTYTNIAAIAPSGFLAFTLKGVCVSGSTLYAATTSGLSISTDGGRLKCTFN